MTYVEGFIVAVPQENREAYRQHAAAAVPLFHEFGVQRHVEAWDDDVKEGQHTDFRRAVQAKDGEKVVFSWFEYPDKAARDAANAKIMSDPRMEEIGKSMPFDGKRMVFGGFAPFVDVGSSAGTYVDGFVLPVPEAKREAYHAMANQAWENFRKHGALRLVEAWGDDVPDGQVTDFRRSVAAEPGEGVVFSWIEWPSKQARDEAWPKIMEDPTMQPDGEMPFDGKRMFWGGFETILDERKG
ncbi:DUF1428 domain-containing protein [uncultured Sphingomonas sp.]|uniref:DUF1428 domain-containing protein n=1 Tax=uncultured Sphingomonas sp. TaxID=158754 RepID=UPI0034576E50